MKTRNFFASANTSKGFVNFFDNILTKNKMGFRYVIKGGSGTGKSTLMKKVGQYFADKGYTIENYFCSSDPHSLDGVKIVEANICILDGTSPHVTEANVPMIKDKIINLGEYIGDGVFEYRNEIEKILSEKKKLYSLVYNYLSACGDIYLNSLSVYKETKQDYLPLLNNILTRYRQTKNEPTPVNELFISALDTVGIKSFIQDNGYKQVTPIPLNDYYYLEFLSALKEKLYEMGYTVTEFKNLLCPEKPFALFVKETDEIFVLEQQNHLVGLTQKNQKIIDELIKICGQTLVKIKKLHFRLEKYYVKNLNIAGLDWEYGQTIKDIEKKISIFKTIS